MFIGIREFASCLVDMTLALPDAPILNELDWAKKVGHSLLKSVTVIMGGIGDKWMCDKCYQIAADKDAPDPAPKVCGRQVIKSRTVTDELVREALRTKYNMDMNGSLDDLLRDIYTMDDNQLYRDFTQIQGEEYHMTDREIVLQLLQPYEIVYGACDGCSYTLRATGQVIDTQYGPWLELYSELSN